MRASVVWLLPLVACSLSDIDTVEEGYLEVDGARCAVDVRTSIGFGFCLDGDSVFSVAGNGDCGDVTVWLDPASATGGSVELHPDSNDVAGGRGAVWVHTADDDGRWTSTSGSALVIERYDGVIAVEFDAQLEDFLDGTPGPSASGLVLCDPA